MDNKKRLGIFIIGTALIILIAMALFVYFLNKKSSTSNPNSTSTPAVNEADKLMQEAKNQQANPNYTFDPKVEKQRPLNSEDLKQISLAFAERFGSYSNQSNYDNIRDLKIFMTSSMISWSDGYIAELTRQNTSYQNYYGITTTAISGQVKSFDDKAGKAEIVVSTQRREINGSSTPQTYDQNLRLVFAKENSQWKVDGAFWLK